MGDKPDPGGAPVFFRGRLAAALILWAALLAGIGAGVYKDAPEACDISIQVKSVQKANFDNKAIYDKYYKLYGKLYNSLKDDYKILRDVENI